jgi:alcohol dehydrogenase class IV
MPDLRDLAGRPALMRFGFATSGRIIFGCGTSEEAARAVAALGKHAFVVTGRHPERPAPVIRLVRDLDVAVTVFSVPTEPTVPLTAAALRSAREGECDVVVGIGGGSVIDTAKVVASLLTNPGEILDYLEVIGGGQQLSRPSAPCIAIPTTAGTGAEVTKNAVLASPEHRVKVSMRSPRLLPHLAVVDPLLTHSIPPSVTAATGLDALTQLLEAFVTDKSNPLTDSLCREGLVRAARSLTTAWEHGSDAAAREDMALASLFGGLALANAGLGAAHGLAGPIGGMFAAPHGAVCAALLPGVMAANVRALRSRAPATPAVARYEEVARLLTGDVQAVAEDGVAWVQSLCRALHLPSLEDLGVRASEIPAIVEKARASSSMKGNPIELTPEELRGVLEAALEGWGSM